MKRLTKKQKGFVKDYVNGETGTQAALNNYNIHSQGGKISKEIIAANIASETLEKPYIQDAIKSIAESIPNELIIKKHLALLNKKEYITKNNITTGNIDVISTGEIDTQAVKAGLDMAYKLKGFYSAEKEAPQVIQVNIQNILSKSYGE